MTGFSYRWYVLLLLVGICVPAHAQHPDPPSHPLFEFLPADTTHVWFTNIVHETESYNALSYTNAYNGNGIAVGDVNGDGLPDIFFPSTHVGSRLYLNRGNFQFEDVSKKAGVLDSSYVERGAAMVDIDGDGDLDIYVCRINGPNFLYINNGDGTFTDQAKKYGLDYRGQSTHAVFFDYDNDGDLDMYLGLTGNAVGDYYARWGDNDKMFRNDGKGKFTEVTKQAGITDAGYCNNVVVGDLNNDGYPDIFISNDFDASDCCYLNNRDGTFTLANNKVMGHTSNSSMGSDIADYNNDGWADIFVDDMLPEDRLRQITLPTSPSRLSPVFDSTQVAQNVLHLNRGGYFSDIAPFAGVTSTDWSWGLLLGDFDLDGYKDMYVANGMRRNLSNEDTNYRVDQVGTRLEITKRLGTLRLPHYAFRNNHDLTFTKVSHEWGVDQVTYAYGAIYADLDQDGDLDLIISNMDSVSFIYRNHAVEDHLGNYLRIKFDGNGLNRFGVGARVELKANGKYQMQDNFQSKGYMSTTEPLLVFGVGQDTVIDELTVTWPGGARQILTNVRPNQTITLKQTNASRKGIVPPKPVVPVFTEPDIAKIIDYRHSENTFDDLKQERLLPHRLSQLGPGAAVGDVNGDGLEDLYLGDARGFPGRIFFQTQAGRFVDSKDTAAFSADAESEDMGAVFFDADGDGDLDLYVVSGGNEYFVDSPELQDRLYLNDGKGHFTKAVGALPEETTSGSCVVAADYDADGDV
ncbi:MAG: RNA-binding protein, partial [Chlorobi bacterium]|nr:RNA-binding protein [Chlorobiota bacterium]